MNIRNSGLRALTVLMAAGAWVALAPSHALAIADVPYFADAKVEPNVFMAIDSSGSMDTADIPPVANQACGGSGPACRKRIDVAREVLSGYATPSDSTDTGNSIVDQFGTQVRFVYGRFLAGDTIIKGLYFPLVNNQSVDTPVFSNSNLNTLKTTIKNTPTDAWTPSSSFLLDIGCWILGEEGMNKGFKAIYNGEDKMRFPVMRLSSLTNKPVFSYDYLQFDRFDWTTGGNFATPTDWSSVEIPPGFASTDRICRSDMREPHVRPDTITITNRKYNSSGVEQSTTVAVTVAGDPAFSCRQTFVIYVTDGEQSVGFGQGGRPDLSQLPSFDPDYNSTNRCSNYTKTLLMALDTGCTASPFSTTQVTNAEAITATQFRTTDNVGSTTNDAYNDYYAVFVSTSAATSANLWQVRQISDYYRSSATRRYTFSASQAWPVAPAAGDEFVVIHPSAGNSSQDAAAHALLPCSIDNSCSMLNCPTHPWFNSDVQKKRRGWSTNRVGTDRRWVYTSSGLVEAVGRSGQASSCTGGIGTWYENWGPGFKTAMSAMRLSSALPAGSIRRANNPPDPYPGDGILTYTIGIAAPTNTILRISNDQAGRAGGTDATPDNPDKCLSTNEDGNESFNAFSASELTESISRALQCILRGTNTRAAPAFVVSGAGFSSSREVDAFFEVTADNAWWLGHLVSFRFGELQEAAEKTRQARLNDPQAPAIPPVPEFDAGELLTARTTADPRKIYFSTNPIQAPPLVSPAANPTAAEKALGAQKGVAINPVISSEFIEFKSANASAIAPFTGGGTTAETAGYIDFIRDEDGVAGNVVTFNDGSKKKWALGPIVNSTPVIVEAPFFDPLLGGNSEKYISFINANELRPTLVYVGANDGLMHAFVLEDPLKGITAASNILQEGYELFAFMPHEAARRLQEMKSGVVFTVDGQISVANVQFFGSDPIDPADDSFRTVLIGGLRSGGFSYYGMDVTDPKSPKLLWEVSHPLMARSFARPNINRFKVINDPNDPTSPALSRWLFAVGGGLNAARTDDNDTLTINSVNCAFYTSEDAGDCFSNVAKTTVLRPAPPVGDPTYATACPGGQTPEALCVDSSGNVEVNPVPPAPGVPDVGTQEIGNWVFVFDIERGFLYEDIRIGDLAADARRNSIPGDLLLLDRTRDGHVDNIIFGDIEGRLWKINVNNANPANWVKDADNDGGLDPQDSPCVMFNPENSGFFDLMYNGEIFTPTRRPIFYAPTATFDCNGDVNLFFGTGDLTMPNDTTKTDYLYAIKDKDPNGCGINPNTVIDFRCPVGEVAANGGSIGLTSEQAEMTRKMFPIKLPRVGEKILSSPLVFNGEMFVTTFIPLSYGCSAGKSAQIFARAICCNTKLKNAKNQIKDYISISDPGDLLPPPVRTPQGGAASPTAISSLTGGEPAAVTESTRNAKMSRYFTVLGMPYIP